MAFKSLEEKCLYYRSLSDYRLLPGTYTIIMLDGRSFSKLIKNKFQRPFSEQFISMMNKTGEYLCQNIMNCKFAYIQSDEITLIIDNCNFEAFFSNRLCKLQSIIASMATSKFNQLLLLYKLQQMSDNVNKTEIIKEINELELCEFDCKAWNVPNFNDAFAWVLYRQNDCIKNSKQQTAQTYLSYKELKGLNTDEQIDLLYKKKNIDWNIFSSNVKYGRFIYKEEKIFYSSEQGINFTRNIWSIKPAFPLNIKDNKERFFNIFKNKDEHLSV